MKKVFGSSPITTIVALVLAGLFAYQAVTEKGETDKTKIIIAVCIAVLGRFMKDSDGVGRRRTKKLYNRVMPEQENNRVPKMKYPPAPPKWPRE
jgi:hypothetical protein